MNAQALVFCLLDAEGEYTPDGYRLLDTAQVGDYELKLWQGNAHFKGQPVKFNEVSLNAKGRSFDPESQHQKFRPTNTHALGKRGELLKTIIHWINRWGELYIGSYLPSKLKVYHHLFRRYLPHLNVSDPFAPFDECEGKPEYFHVTTKPGIGESVDEIDPEHYRDQTFDIDRIMKERRFEKSTNDWAKVFPANDLMVAVSVRGASTSDVKPDSIFDITVYSGEGRQWKPYAYRYDYTVNELQPALDAVEQWIAGN